MHEPFSTEITEAEDLIDYLVFYSKRKSDDLIRLEKDGWMMLNSFVNNKSDHIYVLSKHADDCKSAVLQNK